MLSLLTLVAARGPLVDNNVDFSALKVYDGTTLKTELYGQTAWYKTGSGDT